MSDHPARIVETPNVCGGRPRLDGHRLDIAWYADIREAHGEDTINQIHQGWPYLRDDQIQALSDYYDAHPEWHYTQEPEDMTEEQADKIEIDALRKMIEDLEEAQRKYAAALMVYDITVACLEPFLDDKGMMGGQIKAARTAFTEATGEVPFKLRKFQG